MVSSFIILVNILNAPFYVQKPGDLYLNYSVLVYVLVIFFSNLEIKQNIFRLKENQRAS